MSEGDRIEILLLEERIAEASSLSCNIKKAITEIEFKLKASPDIEIIIAGGDDLLIKYESSVYNVAFLEEIKKLFQLITGNSMSCGIGENIPQAVRNLYLAKLYGKNRIKGLE